MAYPGEAGAGRRSRSCLVGLVLTGAVFGPLPESACAGSTQQTVQSTLIHPADWGIQSRGEVSYGRISLIHDPAGTRLAVYRLWDGSRDEPAGWGPSRAPRFEGDDFIVSDFDSGVRNRR